MLASLLAVAVAVAASGATNASIAARIEHGRALLSTLDYDAAALELTIAAQDPAATEAERVEANLYAGIAQRVLGHDTDARLCFVYVLRHKPDATLPDDVAPKISTFFQLVREELAQQTTAPRPPASTTTTATTATTTTAATAATTAPATSLPLAAIGVGTGAVVAVAGGVAFVVGAVPWFQHAEAHDALIVAEANGDNGAALQTQQRDAREAWESWGVVVATVGGASFVVGAAVVVAAGVAWSAE